MAKRKARAQAQDEIDQSIADQVEGSEENNEPTFAEAKGTEGNQKAKALAKAKAEKEAAAAKFQKENASAFYSIKGDKLLKHIAKPGKVFTVFVGNMKKHGDQLEVFIKKVKAQNRWLKAEDVNEHMGKLQAELQAKFDAIPKKKKA